MPSAIPLRVLASICPLQLPPPPSPPFPIPLQGSYPSLLDDDGKSLSYYGVADGGELLIEEINPAEAARQAAEEAARREAALAAQAALGDVLHKAQEASVAADRRAVLSTAAPVPAAVAAPVAAKAPAAKPAARKPKPADDDDDAI